MSEQPWQVTVLTELGIPLSGLVVSDPSGRPMPSSAPRAAGSQAPAGGMFEVTSAPPPELRGEPSPPEAPALNGGAPAPSVERNAVDSYADEPPADDGSFIAHPLIGGTVLDLPEVEPEPPSQRDQSEASQAEQGPAPTEDRPAPPQGEQTPQQAEPPSAPQESPAPPQVEQVSPAQEEWFPPQAEEAPPAQGEWFPPSGEQAPSPQGEQASPSQPERFPSQASPPQTEEVPPMLGERFPPQAEQAPPAQGERFPPSGEQAPSPQGEQASPSQPERFPSQASPPQTEETSPAQGERFPPQVEQASPPQAEQLPPAQWERFPPQAEQAPPAQGEGLPPQVEQAPSPQAEQAPPAQWEQFPPVAWDQPAPPWEEAQAPPRQDTGGQPSWAEGGPAQADQEQPLSWMPNAAPQWEQNAPAAARQEAPAEGEQGLSPWEPPPQVRWDDAAQPSWGSPAAPQDAPRQPEQGAWPAGSEAWRQDPGAPQDRPVGGSVPSEPPFVPGPTQAGPPATGAPLAARDLVRRSAYGDPLMRRMSRGVRRAVGASAAGDVRKAADVEAVLSRPVPSCRQIAVTSIRGGAGKTTVAGLTATAIAQYRQDRVLAVDADSGLGSLPLRMGVGPQLSLHDLMSAQPRSFEDASRYLAQTTDGLWVLSGTAGGRIAGELDLATFRTAAGAMSRYFAATVIDCGAGLLPELQRGIMTDAHAQVMVTPGTVDGALSAHGALEWQMRNGYDHLLPRTVIAFVTHTPHVDADLTRAAQMLSSGGLPVVHVPYDRHLAAGTAVEAARIGHETRAAVIRIAVEAFARAVAA
ncbi:MinD/ParA family protein [Actinoallomurus liliacearum]|uniref:MinD/ParA family protein n=1 Tax=Actinoallomurus liliacearum TaxID=1080073 RepID=A0ABP8TKU7_9ACTN